MTHDILVSAIVRLRPNAQWVLRGDTLDDLEWLDDLQVKPTLVEVDAEIEKMPKYKVAKSAIISRLTDDQLAAATRTFLSNDRIRERWYAPDQGYINNNDPDAIALLQQIGADVSVVLAPG